jgi:GAF domain-containing protein
LPAFLCRFVAEFPAPLAGRAGKIVRSISGAGALAGLLIVGVNLSFLIWLPVDRAADWRQRLRPIGGAGSFYYPLVFGASALAFTLLFVRAWRAAAEDKQRMRLFTGGLLFGIVPIALQGALDAIPAYNRFVHGSRLVELVVGLILFGALAMVPFFTAYSVLFDRVVELRVVLRAAVQYGLARYSILGATLVPFAGLALFIYAHRTESIVSMLAGPRPIALGSTVALGLATFRMRRPILARLDRRFFREQYDAERTLDRFVTDSLRITDARSLEERIQQTIERTMHADVRLFVAVHGSGVLRRAGDGSQPIADSGVLISLAMADGAPMDVDPSDDRSPFPRLPADEQRWLLATRASLLVALRAADGRSIGLLTLSAKRSGLPYMDDDRRLLSAVGASASLALDNVQLRSTPEPSAEAAARECPACRRLHPPDTSRCACGSDVVSAAAPYILRGIFRIERRIGEGGMGVVYHARDLSLDRWVAIKTLPRVTPTSTARLRREARAMAAVIHPNLAVIHGIETWKGVPFLIEEFLPGGSLTDRIAGGPLSVAAALDLCATLAGALEHLHQAGIVHRDIKPSNIAFTQSGLVKLLDFGLAKLLEGAAGPADTTHDGVEPGWNNALVSEQALVGTLPYMSPEALLGQPPRPAFDLWAVSVVLYECLTGRRPFDARDHLELASMLAAGAYTPPSSLSPSCGSDIDAFFARAFSGGPAARFQDAAALRYAIGALRNEQRDGPR